MSKERDGKKTKHNWDRMKKMAVEESHKGVGGFPDQENEWMVKQLNMVEVFATSPTVILNLPQEIIDMVRSYVWRHDLIK